MMYSPFGYNSSFSHSPYSRGLAAEDEARRRQRRAAEEARRRSEHERYYRMLAEQQKEEEEERMRQEYKRQLQQQRRREQQEEAEKEHRRQAHARLLQQRQREEEEQRQAYEVARLRRQQAEAEEQERAQQRYRKTKKYQEDFDEEDDEPEFQIVRGRDGRLYRVRNPAYQQQQVPRRQQTKQNTEKSQQNPIGIGPFGRLFRGNNQPGQDFGQSSMDMSTADKENTPSTSRDIPVSQTMEVDSKDEVAMKETKSKKEKKSSKGKKKKKRITVIVEDASDSENDDDYKSPWRNRRPSPGQWIEPVDNFHSQ